MIQELPIDRIDPNPFQTRKIPEGDPVPSIETLALLRVALIVREVGTRYQLTFGHRVLHTLKKFHVETVNCDVRELDDVRIAKMFYYENEDRDL